MAKYSIYSADGTIVRFTGTPQDNGVFGKPSYLEFAEIASPTPIDWAIGDYVEYTRTGHTYRLYSIPQPKKQAEKNKYGASFVYRNVQLHAATKDLTIAPFRDLVLNDNLIHYSTLPDVSTFEDVYGIADRIQACLNDLYPNKWIIRVEEITDPTDELYIKLHEVQEFVVSNGTCLDALDKIYQQWKGIGWVHTFENGKEVITIGRPNIRDAENTTSVFSYKGNGLTVIARENSRSNEFATRLYAYGSDRNMIARYYNNLSPAIHNAESVYLPNIMLPRAYWGTTDGKKDARKAYLQADAATIAKYGIIPKIVYFNSDEYGDIYPSIERVTAKNIRDAKTAMGDTAYVPDTTIYPDNTFVDEIKSAANPSDNGIISEGGNKYFDENTYPIAEASPNVSGTIPAKINPTDRPVFVSLEPEAIITLTNGTKRRMLITPNTTITLTSNITMSAAYVFLDLAVNGKVYESLTLFEGSINDTTKAIDTTAFTKHYIPTNAEYKLVPRILVIYNRATTEQNYTLTANVAAGTVDVSAEIALDTIFVVRIKQIGFDISKQGSSSQGLATISFKSGNCAGRDFMVQQCAYNAPTDDWTLVVQRSKDDSLGQHFPNNIYPVAAGDRFVITDMVMPELYIHLAESKLEEKAIELLEYLSKPKPIYTPEIDAKKLAESPQTIIEGMYMHLTDTDIIVGDEYVLIDTLTIDESGTIPTYSVTLRDEKRTSTIQTLRKIIGTGGEVIKEVDNKPVEVETKSSGSTPTDAMMHIYDESVHLAEMEKSFLSHWSVVNVGTDEEPHYILKANLPVASDGDMISFFADGYDPEAEQGYIRLDTWENYDNTTMAGYVLSAGLAYGMKTAIDDHETRITAIEQGGGGGGTPITIDSVLSDTSENPVQNKIITAALNGKAAASHTHAGSDITSMVTDANYTRNLGTSYACYNYNTLKNALDGKASSTHKHTAADIESGTIAIARLPVGTTSDKVAAGNHTHSEYLTTDAAANLYLTKTVAGQTYLGKNDTAANSLKLGGYLASDYLTENEAAQTYQTQSSMSGYLTTQAAMNTYATLDHDHDEDYAAINGNATKDFAVKALSASTGVFVNNNGNQITLRCVYQGTTYQAVLSMQQNGMTITLPSNKTLKVIGNVIATGGITCNAT